MRLPRERLVFGVDLLRVGQVPGLHHVCRQPPSGWSSRGLAARVSGPSGRARRQAPKPYFKPPYVGSSGWIGINLDQIVPELTLRCDSNGAILVAKFGQRHRNFTAYAPNLQLPGVVDLNRQKTT